jgi:hypothetical protein
MSKRLKTPSDYPQLQFRVSSPDEREELEALISEVLEALKDRRKEGELLPKKNQVMASALRAGLKAQLRKLK